MKLHFGPYHCTMTPHLQPRFFRNSASHKRLVGLHLYIMDLKIKVKVSRQELDCWLDDKIIVVWFSAGARMRFLLQSIQTFAAANTASYWRFNRGCVSGSKAAGAWNRLLTPSNAEFKNEWNCTSVSLYAFMAGTRKSLPLPCLEWYDGESMETSKMRKRIIEAPPYATVGTARRQDRVRSI